MRALLHTARSGSTNPPTMAVNQSELDRARGSYTMLNAAKIYSSTTNAGATNYILHIEAD